MTSLTIVQHDISAAFDEECRLYYENTPDDECLAGGLKEAMQQAYKAPMKKKTSDNEKMFFIANSKHGPQFLVEVNRYFSSLMIAHCCYLVILILFVSLQINAHWRAKEKLEVTPKKLRRFLLRWSSHILEFVG